MMSKIQKVNITFLVTLLVALGVSYFGLASVITTYTGRLIFSQVILMLPSFFYFILSRQTYSETVCFRKMRVSTILWTILLGFLTRPLLTFVNAISMLYTSNSTATYMTRLLDEIPYVLALVVVALIPCIFEESVYRGVFYNEYRKARPAAAVFFSALMFGLMHGNLNQFTYAFVMGIIFALVIEATDSILSTMVIHFITNALSISLLYLLDALLPQLAAMRDEAAAAGDTVMTQMMESMIGTGDVSMDAIMDAASQSDVVLSFGDVISSYGMSAIVFTVLAFLVYRHIALKNGRWEHIKSIFKRRNNAGDLPAVNEGGTLGAFAVPTGERLLTLPLLIGMIMCVADIVLNELLLRGIITL